MSDFSDEIEEESDFGSPSPAAKKPAPKKAAAPKKADAAPKPKAAAKRKEKENADDDDDDDNGGEKEVAGKTKNAVGKTQTIEEAYQKLTQLQHVLKRPDTYIGSCNVHESDMWVWNGVTEKMEFRTISFPPGLYKIFDEILVNAADNAQRSTAVKMKNIKVTINQASGTFTVWNDGQGIPIDWHKTENMYVPEMIFGELLTGTNFNDDIAKVAVLFVCLVSVYLFV
jgi:DNA topoisomerase-2